MFDIEADLQKSYNDGYKCGRLDALAELLKYIGEMGDYDGERQTEPIPNDDYVETGNDYVKRKVEEVEDEPQTERSE